MPCPKFHSSVIKLYAQGKFGEESRLRQEVEKHLEEGCKICERLLMKLKSKEDRK